MTDVLIADVLQVRLRELRCSRHLGRLQGHLLLQYRLSVDRRHRDASGNVHVQVGCQPGVQGLSGIRVRQGVRGGEGAVNRQRLQKSFFA